MLKLGSGREVGVRAVTVGVLAYNVSTSDNIFFKIGPQTSFNGHLGTAGK